jgi:molecular chaperone DnaK
VGKTQYLPTTKRTIVTDSQQGIFGIDLGTTYSVVGYIDETGRASVTRNSAGSDTTPSVVYFENESNVIVGQVAKESAGLYPDQVVSLIKREMGDRDYRRKFFEVEHTPPSISAVILEALARDAEADTGRKVTDAVITVPAYFGLLEKDATRRAGEIAGLNVIGIVPEPVAAALHYGVTGSAAGTTFLVYDLGGGTFDISLIKMTDQSVEVLVVGGDHRLGGADWDQKLFDYLVDQTIAQCGDDSLRDDEAMLQELRTLAERTKKDLSAAETKTVIVRYTGTAAKITVTRAQFEQMTAELLDDTIRITQRTLAEAEEKYPGIREQISEVLLVGGSTRMPAVSVALQKEFGWNPKLADPDLAVAKGAALYAAGQTVRWVDRETAGADGQDAADGSGKSALAGLGPVTEEAVQAVAGQTGIAEESLRSLAQKTVVNVLPKAIGVKLIDTDKPGWQDDPESACYIEHLVDAQTQLPFIAEPFVANTVTANQAEIEIEIWEQAGASAARELTANHPLDASGRIKGLAAYALPMGSPVNIEFRVDAEGTVSLRAVEPASNQELKLSVRISILTEEQLAEATRVHAGLTIST